MPQKDKRAVVVAAGPKSTDGRMNVRYRAANGHSFDALVLSAGTSSGLKLRIANNQRVIDNVAAASGMHDTNVYYKFEQ